MRTVYRLEDKDGNGPFFYRNGVCRTNSEIQFPDEGLYCFTDPHRFLEQNYCEFLRDDRFALYKITVSELLFEWPSGQAIFDESRVVEKMKWSLHHEK